MVMRECALSGCGGFNSQKSAFVLSLSSIRCDAEGVGGVKVPRHRLLAALILPPDILRRGSRRYLPASGQTYDSQEAEWVAGGGRGRVQGEGVLAKVLE